MDTISLKKYIFENKKIEYVLEKIGCYNIKYHSNKEFYSCCNYNGDNPNAVNVKNNEYLDVRNWTRESEFDENSDIITLVQYNKNFSFIEAIKYIHGLLGLEYKFQKIQKKTDLKDPLNVFKRVKSKVRVNVADLKVLNEDTLEEFLPLLHISWLREGIMQWTAKKFGLAYSYKRKRVIIPMRYWLTGELLGINARTTIENYKELGIKKYFITPSYPKNINLYGLYENIEEIQKAGYVVIVEAEKSVLKRDSLGDSTLVALSGHTISEEQIRILIGLNVEIIVALDKDISQDEVRHICNKFYGIRKVSYMWDKYGLIGEKDSPADARNKIYQYLFKHRIVYDNNERKEYLKSLNKK